MKTCSCCGLTKEDGDFYTLKSGRLHSWCKKCTVKKSQERNSAAYIPTRHPDHYDGRKGRVSILKVRDVGLKNKSVCAIIHDHHDKLKDDPERLRTDFIQKLVDVNCKNGVLHENRR
jgi:hypothetical protein